MLKIIRSRKPLFLFSFVVLLSFAGCKKDNDETPVKQMGAVLFVFENYVDSTPLMMDTVQYVNDAGNLYSVSLLKYYVSNFCFSTNDNFEFNAGNYNLINEEISNSKSFAINVPYGNYSNLKFFLGVDSVKNISGAQAGALDPVNGMFWDWNSGYIYFKHEGAFIDNGSPEPLSYHFGTLEALNLHSFSVNLNVGETPRIVKIRFNLNKLYRSPNVVDFHNNNINSGGTKFIKTLRENFDGAFEIISIQ